MSLTTPIIGFNANSQTIAIASNVAMTGKKKIALYNSLPNFRLDIKRADPSPRATEIGTTIRT